MALLLAMVMEAFAGGLQHKQAQLQLQLWSSGCVQWALMVCRCTRTLQVLEHRVHTYACSQVT